MPTRAERARAVEDAGNRVLYEIDRGIAFPRVRFSISTYGGRKRQATSVTSAPSRT